MPTSSIQFVDYKQELQMTPQLFLFYCYLLKDYHRNHDTFFSSILDSLWLNSTVCVLLYCSSTFTSTRDSHIYIRVPIGTVTSGGDAAWAWRLRLPWPFSTCGSSGSGFSHRRYKSSCSRGKSSVAPLVSVQLQEQVGKGDLLGLDHTFSNYFPLQI